MVKIGRTTRNPRDRIDELSAATAIPTPFVLAFDAYVEDCERAEAYVHARLEKDGYRVAKNGSSSTLTWQRQLPRSLSCAEKGIGTGRADALIPDATGSIPTQRPHGVANLT